MKKSIAIVFAALSVAGMLLLDRRARQRLGEAGWQALARDSSSIPFARLPRVAVPSPGTAARFGGGIALYVLLLVGHPLFAGVMALAS